MVTDESQTVFSITDISCKSPVQDSPTMISPWLLSYSDPDTQTQLEYKTPFSLLSVKVTCLRCSLLGAQAAG